MKSSLSRDRDEVDLVIDTLGDGGDGVAQLDQRSVFVPWTMPGERVHARRIGSRHALPLAWHDVHPDRAAPACTHYTACGGCTLQHLPTAAYVAWKFERARDACRRAGFPDAPIGELVRSAPATRRRATFALIRTTSGLLAGFHAPMSRDVVDVVDCAVVAPALLEALAALRPIIGAAIAIGGRIDLALSRLDGGIDALLLAAAAPDAELRARLIAWAEANDVARIAAARAAGAPAELLALRRVPRVVFDDVLVEPPPGVFLQPTTQGEAAIRAALRDGLRDARKIADLYAGCGAFALPLAATGRGVIAVDADGAAIAALDAAARRAGLTPRLRASVRDLARRPLVPQELAGLDAVIFDPPRDGARAQAQNLAQSDVPTVIAVSCNPATFARDAALLREGGYRLEALTPIDQFLWSAHLELVGVFRRAPVRRSRRAPA